MRSSRLLAPLSVMILAPTFFMLSGCVYREHTVREVPAAPTEGYYDSEHHRWYHENTWVECEEHDPHCAAPAR